ncbi:MAG: hypothetical protein SFZ03_02895 [Candidatus Melainabacteria bacterium]|nr:hypothetical protein [Candidatus Melainabacteria bacterium]
MAGQLNVTPPLQPNGPGVTRQINVGDTNLGPVQNSILIETSPNGDVDNPGGGNIPGGGGNLFPGDNTDTILISPNGQPLGFGQNVQLFQGTTSIPLVNPGVGNVGNVDLSPLFQQGGGLFGDGQVINVTTPASANNLNPVELFVAPATQNADGTNSVYILPESRPGSFNDNPRRALTDGQTTIIETSPDGSTTSSNVYNPATDGPDERPDGPGIRATGVQTQDAQRDIQVIDTQQTVNTDSEVLTTDYNVVNQEGISRTSQQTRNDTEVIQTDRVETEQTPVVLDTTVEREEVTIRQEVQESEQSTPLQNNLNSVGDVLNHATGEVRRDAEGNPITDAAGNTQQTPHQRYTDGFQIEGSNTGVQATYQTRPLNADPDAAPTVVSGTARLRPPQADQTFAEFGITLTQYAQPTHDEALDTRGNELRNGNDERYLVPTGIGSDIQYTGYVPQGEIRSQIPSQNGVFTLPQSGDVQFAPPNMQAAGPGDSAYNNAGLLLVERNDGTMVAVPQWNGDGARTEGMTLESGSASRVIHAIAPNGGANIALDQPYAVTQEGGRRFIQFDDGTRQDIISADTEPQNFAAQAGVEGFSDTVYAAEDTRAAGNPAVPGFDGQRRPSVTHPDGSRENTVDVGSPTTDATVAAEADRVVNTPGQPGQMEQTNNVGGFRASVNLGVGIGEQTVITTRDTRTYADGRTIEDTYRQDGTLTSETPFRDTATTPLTITDTFREDGTRTSTTPMRDTATTPITTTTTQTDTYDLNQTGILVGNPATGNISWNDPTLVGQSTSATDLVERGPTTVVTDQTGATTVVDQYGNPVLVGTDVQRGPTTVTTQQTGATQQTLALGDPRLINSEVTAESSRLINREVTQERDQRLAVAGAANVEVAYVQNLGRPEAAWTNAATQIEAGVYGSIPFAANANSTEVGAFGRIRVPVGVEMREVVDAQTGQPLYETMPVLDANGQQVTEAVMGDDGVERQIPVNTFRTRAGADGQPLPAFDGDGNLIPENLIPQRRATGRSDGAIFGEVRVPFTDAAPQLRGGVEFNF